MKVRASVKKLFRSADGMIHRPRVALAPQPQPEQHPLYVLALQLIPSCWYISHPAGGCLLRSLGEVPDYGLVVERIGLAAYRDRTPNSVLIEDVFVLNAAVPADGEYLVRGGAVEASLNQNAQIQVGVLRHMADRPAFYRACKGWTHSAAQTLAKQLECAHRLARQDL